LIFDIHHSNNDWVAAAGLHWEKGIEMEPLELDHMKVAADQLVPMKSPESQKEKALRKACKDFESVFTHELLKSMRRTVEKCDLFHGGQGEEVYESLLDMELSKSIADTGPNSIAAQLYGQLKSLDGSK
jgi:Rod binding domain-containing protein